MEKNVTSSSPATLVVNPEINNEKDKELQEIDNLSKIKSENEIEEIKINILNLESHSEYLEYINEIDKLIFAFINPRSGSEEGKYFFNLADKYNCSKFKDKGYRIVKIEEKDEVCYLYMFNIISSEDYERGCGLLNDYVNFKKVENKIRVVVAGGDGTVLSVIENLNHKQINIDHCIFGHIPLGTGNDLSNALGFGSEISINDKLSSLNKIILKYFEAFPGKVDVWELRLNVSQDGEIIEVKQDNKKPKLDHDGNVLRHYRRTFINYFSLGYDARVGFGFEKKRSGSRCWNKCIYFWEGLKKNCCRKTIPLTSFINSFQVIEKEIKPKLIGDEVAINDQNINNNQHNVETNNLDDFTKRKSIVYFKSRNSVVDKYKENGNGNSQSESEIFKDIVLKGDPVSLVCQNINYYMGGTKDIWRKSKSIGLEVVDAVSRKASREETKTLELLLEQSKQCYNDQKLEFFSYSSGLKIGFEKVATGQADKIYHGPGPIQIQFKDTPERSKLDKFNRVYLNIDGEYYNIVKPVDLRVGLNRNLSGGSINFLINLKSK